METSPKQQQMDSRLLCLSPEDNVRAVTVTIGEGDSVLIDGRPVAVDQRIPTGHKLAVAAIAPGEKVLKYGIAIGSATAAIRPGEYVHTHNLKSDYLPTRTLDTSSLKSASG